MANSRERGKLVFLVLTISLLVSDLLIFSPRLSRNSVLASELDPSSNSNSVIEGDSENGNPDVVFLHKQQILFEKFQELVQNLTQLVARLESQFIESPLQVEKSTPLSPPSSLISSDDETKTTVETKDGNKLSSKEDILPAGGSEEGARASRGAFLKYSTFWPEKFQFVSAVKLRSTPTCVNVLPYRDHEGLSKYFAVGDNKGKLYVFFKSGDISLEIDAFSKSEESSPISATTSVLSVFKNETIVVTGHENGIIVIHRVWEILNGDDWNSLRVERLGRFESVGGSRINLLEVHYVGRKRYILAVDGDGKITVLCENGKLYGSVTPSRQPIVFLKQRLLFLTDTGAGSLDLRTMKLKETACEGLNNSFVRSYVFDVVDRTKAYGYTSEGDLVHTLLLGDVMNFKCRIRLKRKLDLDQPTALHAIRGYLMIGNKEKVYVYNVSTHHYVRAGGPRLLFSAGLDEIKASFLNHQAVDSENDGATRLLVPLISSDYDKVVVMSLGNGYVAMYRSNLPIFKKEFNSILWTSPVLFFVLFLFGAWHFFAKKKDALVLWGPDDPSSASVAGGANKRAFPESSRNSEIMELRGSGSRSNSRYVSPPRNYAQANSYRTGGDMDSRTVSVDPRFRTTSEMKYRGPPVDDGGGVSNRRDALFVNGQVVDD